MKMVDNARTVCKHISTKALALAATVQTGWLAYPDSMKADLPPSVAHGVATVVAIVIGIGLVAKFIQQDSLAKDEETKDTP
ncbi:MAG: hypothetical protein JWR07_1894 [Nevskia sp.]|nr:hypothetical protein [Nevskia sp.]